MKVSIIIPSLGRKILADVLESILINDKFAQISPEIIVIFNGEDTQKFSRKKFLKHSNIKFYNCKVPGCSAARNAGLSNAQGEIIIFLGDDTIPAKNWLETHYNFHINSRNRNCVLLGQVKWHKKFAFRPFYKWLENGVLFNFRGLRNPNFRHFYTSNISLSRALIGREKFSKRFFGWGFEDTEFGYRLQKKGMLIDYDETCRVFHHHEQSLSKLLCSTEQARQNAKIFESLHSEVRILPRGYKLLILKILIWGAKFVPKKISRKIYWWRKWKQSWIGDVV